MPCLLILMNCHALKWSVISFNLLKSRRSIGSGVPCLLILMNCHALKWSVISFNLLKSQNVDSP